MSNYSHLINCIFIEKYIGGSNRPSVINNLKDLQEMQVPTELGRDIGIILGIAYNSDHPEVVHTLPSSLKILIFKFLPAKKGKTCCIGGPLSKVNTIVFSVLLESKHILKQNIYHVINLFAQKR